MRVFFGLKKAMPGLLMATALAMAAGAATLQAQPNAAIDSWSPPGVTRSPDVRIRPAAAVMGDYFDAAAPEIVSPLKNENFIYVRFRNDSINIILDGTVTVRAEYAEADAGISGADLVAEAAAVASWETLGSYVMTLVFPPDPPPGFGLFPGAVYPTPLEVGTPADYRISCSVDCDQPLPASFFLRVTLSLAGDSDAGDNVALSYYDQAGGIPPVDVVLLHDLSGSMAPHLAEVKQRASFFLALLNAGDRMGVVGFSTQFTGNTEVSASLAPIVTIDPSDPAKTFANDRINLFNASGATPMGSGVIKAREVLNAALPPYPANRAIVMLTDGKENQDPRLNDPPFDILHGLNDDGNGPIALYPLWFGAVSNWGKSLLENIISEVDNGKLVDQPFDDLKLAEAYLMIRGILTADDVYAIHRGTTGDGYQGAVSVDPVTGELILTVSWKSFQRDLDISILPPGATDWQPAAWLKPVTSRGELYVVHRFQKPAPGQWRYRLSRAPQGEPYVLAALADKVEIVMQSWLQDGSIAAGETLVVNAKLMRRGKPVRGASLRAAIQVPQRSLGTLLNDHRDRFQVAVPTAPDATRATGVLKQLQGFVGSEKIFSYQTQSVVLDDSDSDGIYSASFNDTRVAGTYMITITADSAPGPGGQGFQRRHNHAAIVSLGPVDTGNSRVEIVRERGTNTGAVIWAVSVFPVDIYGNFADPGYVGRFDLQASAGGWLGNAMDWQDGSYRRLLQLPAGQTAQVSVTAFGEAFPTKKVPVGGADGKRAQVSFHTGTAAPLGAFNDSFNPGASFAFDLGYRIDPRFSLLAFFGLHDFPRQTGGSETAWQISGNLRAHPSGGRLFPYVQGGPGLYRIFSNWNGGFNLGGGVVFAATPRIHLEGGVDYHNIFLSGSDARFLQVQTGFSFHF